MAVGGAIKTTTAPVIVATIAVDRLDPAHQCGATGDEAAAVAHDVTAIGIAVEARGVTATETIIAAAAAVATEAMEGTGGGDKYRRRRVCACVCA